MNRDTTQWVIAGPSTFRLASRMLTLKITSPARNGQVGCNLQNKTKHIKKMYVADKGKVFVKRDQSGAEARIVGYLTRHGQFRDLFLNAIKPHSFVGLHLFKKEWQKEIDSGYGGKDTKCNIEELCKTPISKLKSNPFWREVAELIQSSDNWTASRRYYFIAKQVCHSSNYGIGPGRFVLNTLEKSQGKVALTKRDAEHYLEFYHGTFPEIREWHQDVLEQVRATNYLYNLFGFPKYFFHKGDLIETQYKEYFAFIPQSTVACITRKCFIDMQTFIEARQCDWDMMIDEHDSVMLQCPENEAEECDSRLKTCIEQELTNNRAERFKMKSESGVGKNWGPYHPEKNPDGLKEIFK